MEEPSVTMPMKPPQVLVLCDLKDLDTQTSQQALHAKHVLQLLAMTV